MKSLALALIAAALLTSEGAETKINTARGGTRLGESDIAYRLTEGSNRLDLALSVIPSRNDYGAMNEDFHVWALTRTGGVLRQLEPLQPKASLRSLAFITSFESSPLTNVVALVVAFGGKAVCFTPAELIKPRNRGAGSEIASSEVRPPSTADSALKLPEGEYLVDLEWWGGQQTATVRVKNGKAVVLKSEEPKLVGMNGTFSEYDEESFLITFRTLEGEAASQIWLPQPDRSYIIKEVPDRGEQERAFPANSRTPDR